MSTILIIQTGFEQLKWPSRSFKVITKYEVRQKTYKFVLTFNSNYNSMLHRFRDIST